MTEVVHRVVIVVVDIVAVMGKLVSAIPKMISYVYMTVIDPRINECYHDTFALISHVPNLVGTDLKDIRSDFAHGRSQT